MNPAVIPRNHQVDYALKQAQESEDLKPLHRLLQAIKAPFQYEETTGETDLRTPPNENERIQATFCGT